MSNRADLHSSPAVRLGGQRALELAGIGIDDVEVVDLYSCFPAAVQMGAAALGLGLDRQLTRTGGLSFAGGPVEQLRDARHRHRRAATSASGPAPTGSCGPTAATSPSTPSASTRTTPPAGGLPLDGGAVQAEIDALPRRELAEAADAAGPATVEAYTVMHDRDGEPETASPPASSPTAAGPGAPRPTPISLARAARRRVGGPGREPGRRRAAARCVVSGAVD